MSVFLSAGSQRASAHGCMRRVGDVERMPTGERRVHGHGEATLRVGPPGQPVAVDRDDGARDGLSSQQRGLPPTVISFELSARQSESGTAPPLTVIRTPPPVAEERAMGGGRARRGAAVTGRESPGRDTLRRPRGRARPEREDEELRDRASIGRRGRPADRDATYSLPPAAKTVGPDAIGLPVLNVQSTLPVFEVEGAQHAVAAPREAEPARGRVTPPRSGSGVVNFQTRLPLETSIALIEPWSCQPASAPPKLPFCETEVDVAEQELALLLRRRELLLDEHGRPSRRRR